MEKLDLEYEHVGKHYFLNSNLVNQQGLSQKEVDKLKRSHIIKYKIFSEMELTNDIIRLVMLSKRVKRLEFIQQDIWGFEKNERRHYWFIVPKCSCPKLDNYDNIGNDVAYHDIDCIVHSVKSLELYKSYIKRVIAINNILS